MSDPLSITASLITVIQLSSQAIAYIKNVKDQSSDRGRIRDELRNAVCLFEMLKDRAEEASDGDVRNTALATLVSPNGPLESYQVVIGQLVRKLVPGGSRAASVVRPLNGQRLKTHFSCIIQNDLVGLARLTHSKIDAISSSISSLETSQHLIEKHILFGDSQKILEWVSPLSFGSKHTDILRRVESGTGEWLINSADFRQWRDGNIRTAWCPGIPGAGKTFVAAIIIDHLQQAPQSADTAIAYLYCDFQSRTEQTIINMVTNVLRQLLEREEQMPQDILSLYEEHKQHLTRPSLLQFTSIARRMVDQYRQCFVVVDALDELSSPGATDLVSEILDLGPNLQLLCTSRPLTSLASYFASGIRLDISAHDEDVRLFVENQITTASLLGRHVQADPSLKLEIIDTIADKVEGMFLLAKLHFESLSSKLSRKDVRKHLRQLPRTLDGTYDQALARIYGQSEDEVDLAERILFWIVCSHRPLAVRELQQFYATRSLDANDKLLDDDGLPEADMLTTVCGGLVTLDSHLNALRLVHFTAQEYFERRHAPILQTTRHELTTLSMKFLCLHNFSNGPCENDSQMEQRLLNYPYIEYASRYWGAYVNSMDLEEYWRDFKNFLDNNTAFQVISQVLSLPKHRYTGWSQRYPRDTPPLVLVASAGDTSDLMVKLLEQGKDLEGKGSDGQTALIRSSMLGLLPNVMALRCAGAVVDAVDLSSQTALMHSAGNGHDEVVRFLLEQDSSGVSYRDSEGWTALMAGVTSGKIKVLQTLVQGGSDVSAISNDGDTPLSIAAQSGFQEGFNFLFRSGAKLPANSASRRAIRIATGRGLEVSKNVLRNDFTSVNFDDARDALLERPEEISNFSDLADSTSSLAETLKAVAQGDRQGLQYGSSKAEGALSPGLGLCEGVRYSSVVDSSNLIQHRNQMLEELRAGTSFRQRYQKKEVIGKGVYATVYSCVDRVTGKLYAVKIFDSFRKQKTYWNRVGEEVRIINSVRHPNIIEIHDLVAEDDFLYMVFNLASKGDLFDYIVKNKKLSQKETRTVFDQLFSAIEYLHKQDVAHLDIKPDNVLLMNDDLFITLADFGSATVIRPGEYGTRRRGSAYFYAPEVLVRRYSPAVDVWAAGVSMYICLCGFPPFSEQLTTKDNPYTLAQQIQTGRFDYPSPYWDELSDLALDLIDRMITVDTARRITIAQCRQHFWMTGAELTPAESPFDRSSPKR